MALDVMSDIWAMRGDPTSTHSCITRVTGMQGVNTHNFSNYCRDLQVWNKVILSTSSVLLGKGL